MYVHLGIKTCVDLCTELIDCLAFSSLRVPLCFPYPLDFLFISLARKRWFLLEFQPPKVAHSLHQWNCLRGKEIREKILGGKKKGRNFCAIHSQGHKGHFSWFPWPESQIFLRIFILIWPRLPSFSSLSGIILRAGIKKKQNETGIFITPSGLLGLFIFWSERLGCSQTQTAY